MTAAMDKQPTAGAPDMPAIPAGRRAARASTVMWDALVLAAVAEVALVIVARSELKAGAVGGLYHLATEQAEPVSLRRFGDSLAAWAGLSAGAFGFGGWEQGLRTAMEVMAAPSRSPASRSVPALLVLDEFPYLAQETPGLASIVQSQRDRLYRGADSRSDRQQRQHYPRHHGRSLRPAVMSDRPYGPPCVR
jgi:subtilisin family serine protease